MTRCAGDARAVGEPRRAAGRARPRAGRDRRRRRGLPRAHHALRPAQPSAQDAQMSDRPNKQPASHTRAIHAGQSPDPSTGAIMPPIYATSTYVQQSPGVHKGLDYGRSHNPTRWALERCVADLEGGAQAFAFASGLAAIATVLELLDAGAHVVARRRRLRRDVPPVRARCAGAARASLHAIVDLRIPTNLSRGADARDEAGLGRDADQPAAASSPTSRAIAAICRARGILDRRRQHVREPVRAAAARARLRHRRALDDQVPERPLRRHRRRRGRRRATSALAPMRERLGFLQNAVGAIAGPVRQLPRAARREDAGAAHGAPLRERARARAPGSERSRQVARVHYPGLPSHPQHALAKRADARGFGGMISIELATDLAGTRRFLEAVRIFALAESLGGVESLIEHPAIMTHATIPRRDARAARHRRRAGAAVGRRRGRRATCAPTWRRRWRRSEREA